jgi:hypothetical protein
LRLTIYYRADDDPCHDVVPATTQREQQFTGMCVIIWLAENLSIEKDGGIGSDNKTMHSFWQSERGFSFMGRCPLGQARDFTLIFFLNCILINR